MRKGVPGEITISRVQGSEDSWMRISIIDSASRQSFDVVIDLKEFAQAVTGVGHVECSIELPDDPSRVGKKRQSMVVTAPIVNQFDIDSVKKSVEAHTPEGWEAQHYYGSQSSFFRLNDQLLVRTNAYRWVDE